MPRDLEGICLFDMVLAKVQALATAARVEIVDTFYVEPWEELLGSKYTPFAYSRLAVLAFSASIESRRGFFCTYSCPIDMLLSNMAKIQVAEPNYSKRQLHRRPAKLPLSDRLD